MNPSNGELDDQKLDNPEAPNYTQVPNLLFDRWLSEISSLAELKVLLAVTRKTFGWHKREDALSISYLMELTGLSRPSVIEGCKRAGPDGHQILERTPDGDGSYLYKLRMRKELRLAPPVE